MTNRRMESLLGYILPAGYYYNDIKRTSAKDLYVDIYKNKVFQYTLEAHDYNLGLKNGIKYNTESDYSLDELRFKLQELSEKNEHSEEKGPSKTLKFIMKEPEIKKGKYKSYIRNDSGGFEILDDDYFD